jgi:DNA-binding response OmpR family regulator
MPTPAQKIVIVDDSKSVLHQAATALTKAGFRVVTVDSPFAAAAVMAREQPDLVLMDVHMPAISGDKIVSLMRKRDHLQAMKVVLFSSDEPAALSQLARDCGAAGAVHKGAAMENLVDQVRALLLQATRALN